MLLPLDSLVDVALDPVVDVPVEPITQQHAGRKSRERRNNGRHDQTAQAEPRLRNSTAPISGTVGGRERSGPLRSAVRFLHFAEVDSIKSWSSFRDVRSHFRRVPARFPQD